MRAYDFWQETGTAESSAYPMASLSLRPSRDATANELQMMFPQGTAPDVQLAIADRVLAGVQRWRDIIAEGVDRQRTAVDELAAAREEIARLKAEREDGAE
ncbi:hypothetical protein ABZ725_51660 [Streptomyces sp. NPDC006872]|uniref:hypothetical protein n=1 Tax=Streptomyces sp. NPDC006872 TaxID=3155720 RepID=UPI00340F648E